MPNNQISPNRQKVIARYNQKGFTLIELIISIVIFLIVTSAVYGVMRIALQSRTAVNQEVPLTKNTRFSLNTIGRDTLNAGFDYPLKNTVKLPDNRISALLNIPNDFDNTQDVVPPIIAGNNITLNASSNSLTDQITYVFKDSTFNLVGAAGRQVSQSLSINAASTVGGIDQIVPVAGSTAACSVNDIYVITGNTGSTLGVATEISGGNTIKFANSDTLNFNQSGLGGPLRGITTPASIQRVRMVTYFVTADGILNRREYANAAATTFVDEPLIYGVENLQIQYILGDGTVSDNPSAGADGVPGTADDIQANLATVRQIRFTITVRSIDLNSAGQPNRVTMTSIFGTRNLGYDPN